MTQEIRLPKCLTQEEQEKMRDYIDGVARESKHFHCEKIYDIKWMFLLYKRDMPWTRCFDPVREFYPYCFNLDKEGSLNYALKKTLEDVLTKSFSKAWKRGDILCFFCRAYAMAIHSLNYSEPEGDYGIFSELWQDEKLIEQRNAIFGQMSLTDYDKTQCELICACMVYCILERENEPKTKRLLHQIQLRLESSKSGINLETLETFRQAVAESIEAKTETPTQPTPPTTNSTTDNPKKGKNVGPKSLFLKPEDEAIWKEQLTRFFADEINTPLNASEENGVLRCMVWFLHKFKNLRFRVGVFIALSHKATYDIGDSAFRSFKGKTTFLQESYGCRIGS